MHQRPSLFSPPPKKKKTEKRRRKKPCFGSHHLVKLIDITDSGLESLTPHMKISHEVGGEAQKAKAERCSLCLATNIDGATPFTRTLQDILSYQLASHTHASARLVPQSGNPNWVPRLRSRHPFSADQLLLLLLRQRERERERESRLPPSTTQSIVLSTDADWLQVPDLL
ncbi:uncharacterized protein LY79DRAFT_204901 [Colletotrichum navitas]|uniref:Uncharacterized protein n=1 Tax=Colletotrichum navitas TaxID=681940 RepID=A0AAD8QAD0_9PEZI|nr:uncharacterized protein LY79DRAFT_204901 [Colletotrichum navitas]KAK1598996.1 hypothetical protein LY79DRAFT_204901 [Colletotrichum navitas]